MVVSRPESFRVDPLSAPLPEITLTTDASLQGWGRSLARLRPQANGTHPWTSFHIIRLELEAVIRALDHFSPLVQGRRVLVRSDNTTVVAYINRQGGTHSFPLWQQSYGQFASECPCKLFTCPVSRIPGQTYYPVFRVTAPSVSFSAAAEQMPSFFCRK